MQNYLLSQNKNNTNKNNFVYGHNNNNVPFYFGFFGCNEGNAIKRAGTAPTIDGRRPQNKLGSNLDNVISKYSEQFLLKNDIKKISKIYTSSQIFRTDKAKKKQKNETNNINALKSTNLINSNQINQNKPNLNMYKNTFGLNKKLKNQTKQNAILVYPNKKENENIEINKNTSIDNSKKNDNSFGKRSYFLSKNNTDLKKDEINMNNKLKNNNFFGSNETNNTLLCKENPNKNNDLEEIINDEKVINKSLKENNEENNNIPSFGFATFNRTHSSFGKRYVTNALENEKNILKKNNSFHTKNSEKLTKENIKNKTISNEDKIVNDYLEQSKRANLNRPPTSEAGKRKRCPPSTIEDDDNILDDVFFANNENEILDKNNEDILRENSNINYFSNVHKKRPPCRKMQAFNLDDYSEENVKLNKKIISQKVKKMNF